MTGGSGFIGSHLCDALLMKGFRVINLDCLNDYYDPRLKRINTDETRAICDRQKLPADRYVVVEHDIRDLPSLQTIFQQYEIGAVVHLAAYAGVRPSIRNPALYADVNLRGTLNVLECMREFGVKRHVFASSSSVYGNNPKVPFSEADPVDNPISPYAATKKSGELLCHTYYHLYGISTACLRFFTVYGPRQRPDLAIRKFTSLMMEDKPIPFYGDGTTQRDYTFISDIIDGVLRALDWTNSDEPRYEIFNLGESNTVSLSEMVSTIEKVLGVKAKLNRLAPQPGDVARTWADISKAKAVLGYDPHTPFEEGIEQFVAWYRELRKTYSGV